MLWGTLLGMLFATPVAVAVSAPLEAYGRLPLMEDVVLSPDGKRVAFVTTVGEARSVIIQSLDTRSEIARLGAGHEKLRDLAWAGNDHLLITVSKTLKYQYQGGETVPRQESSVLQSFDLRTRQLSIPAKWVRDAEDTLGGSPGVMYVNGKPVVHLSGWHDHQPTLYRVDLDRQTTSIVESGARGTLGRWLLDSAGNLVARTRYDENRLRWSVDLKRDGRWVEVQSLEAPIDIPSMVGLASEEGWILFRMVEDDDIVYKRLSLADGTWRAPSVEEQGVDRFRLDPMTGRVTAGMRMGEARQYVYFDPALQRVWNKITQAFPGEQVAPVAASHDSRKLIIQAFGTKNGAAYLLVDVVANEAHLIGYEYADVRPEDVAAVTPIRYAAADGLDISGYLTLPKGRPAKGLALIVLPHGGPETSDTMGFDWWAQALASRGYAVLQPNYRGSYGLGRAFQAAGFGQWGHKMQTDLSDGVRYLAAQGVVDPQRVCIAGASYGGYAALAGATLETGVYRCAVSVNGISDLRRTLAQITGGNRRFDSRRLRYTTRYLGVTKPDDTRLNAISPAKQADKVQIPILLIHGTDDTVVRFEQSQLMADALKKAGKPYELVKLEGEDHWLSRANTRLQLLQAMVKFLEINNPPQSDARGASSPLDK